MCVFIPLPRDYTTSDKKGHTGVMSVWVPKHLNVADRVNHLGESPQGISRETACTFRGNPGSASRAIID